VYSGGSNAAKRCICSS